LEKLDFMGFSVAGFGFSEKDDFPYHIFQRRN